MSRQPRYANILNAKASTGVGTTIFCTDHRNIIIAIGTASNANLTVKCQGAIGTTEPSFGTAQSATNHWDYVQMIDLESGLAVDGDTGFVASGTDDFRLFEVNTNGLDYLTLNVTARSAGSVTANARLVTNA